MSSIFILMYLFFVLENTLVAQVFYLENDEFNAVAVSAGVAKGSKSSELRAIAFETGKRKFAFGISYAETKSKSDDKYDVINTHIVTTFPGKIEVINLNLQLGYMGSSKVRIPSKHVVITPSVFLNLAHKITADSYFKIIPEAGISRLLIFEGNYDEDMVSSDGVKVLYNMPTIALGLGLSKSWSSDSSINLISLCLIAD